MRRVPEGFHIDTVGSCGDGVGLTKEELLEERRAARKAADGRAKPRKTPLANPFDEVLKSLGIWERTQAVCREMGVATFELAEDSKARRLVNARKRVYQMLKEIGWSNVDVAKLFGKCPTTVLAALK